MKYKLSSKEFTAILFDVQETKTEVHSSAEAEIKASFFMGEVVYARLYGMIKQRLYFLGYICTSF
jgi:hypothetical protein